jgi:hypothetical protein
MFSMHRKQNFRVCLYSTWLAQTSWQTRVPMALLFVSSFEAGLFHCFQKLYCIAMAGVEITQQ